MYKETVMSIDDYLAEMGWTLSKDGMQYAWLKQALNRQAKITWLIAEKVGYDKGYEDAAAKMSGILPAKFKEAEKAGIKKVGDFVKDGGYLMGDKWQAFLEEHGC